MSSTYPEARRPVRFLVLLATFFALFVATVLTLIVVPRLCSIFVERFKMSPIGQAARS